MGGRATGRMSKADGKKCRGMESMVGVPVRERERKRGREGERETDTDTDTDRDKRESPSQSQSRRVQHGAQAWQRHRW